MHVADEAPSFHQMISPRARGKPYLTPPDLVALGHSTTVHRYPKKKNGYNKRRDFGRERCRGIQTISRSGFFTDRPAWACADPNSTPPCTTPPPPLIELCIVVGPPSAFSSPNNILRLNLTAACATLVPLLLCVFTGKKRTQTTWLSWKTSPPTSGPWSSPSPTPGECCLGVAYLVRAHLAVVYCDEARYQQGRPRGSPYFLPLLTFCVDSM